MISENTRQKQVTTTIRWFKQVDRHSLEQTGGKGANLGEMTQAGLPVPPGFIITADAYRSLLAVDGLDERIALWLRGLNTQDIAAVTEASRSFSNWIQETAMPHPIEQQIRAAYAELSLQVENPGGSVPAVPVAVRSSATAEDLPNASFAGQQETFLNICSAEAVLEAVKKCWASLWTPQAIAYRDSMGFDQRRVALAVVVQIMVPAEVAGVMFTANPVTGRRDEILISASYGLGESVVSGAVTPDTFILSTDGSVRERILGSKETQISPNGCGTKVLPVPQPERSRFSLNPPDLRALADMAKRVQAHYGSPQDTEWAISAGKLYLLQARPITTLKSGTTANTGAQGLPGRDHQPWANEQPGAMELPEAMELPGAIEQSGAIELPLVARPPRGIENTIDHIPEPPMPLDLALIANNSFNLFFEKLGFRPPAEPTLPVERPDGRIGLRFTEPRLSPAILWKLPAHLLFVLRTDPLENWQPLSKEMSAWLQSMEAERKAVTGPVQLAQLMLRSYAGFERLFARRFLAAMIPGILYGMLTSLWVRKAVGKAAASETENRLYRATPYQTALQNQAMLDLARVEREHGRASVEFTSALERFLASWGNRPVRGMIALPSSPTWSEQPEVVLQMVEAMRPGPEGSQDSREAQVQPEAEYQAARAQVENRLNLLYRRWFRGHLNRSRKALVVREQGLSHAEDYNAFLRRAALQLGGMLERAGTLSQPEDIFYLLFSELEPAAQGELADIAERVAQRKQGYQKLLAAHASGQHWLFATGSIPPMKAAQPTPTAGENTLKGLAASQGIVTGRVRVIHGPEEFGRMRKGEILVAPFTAPAWTPLFSLASAVVTDIGSLASHAAIVAREYGIPCVVAAEEATRALRDGQLIEVNGTQGLITILEKAAD